MIARASYYALGLALSWAQPASAQQLASANSVESNSSVAAKLRIQAADHFSEGRFVEAQIAYKEMLALLFAEEREARAVLHFNIASCFYELEEYMRAEEQFIVASRLHPPLAVEAELHAGFAALHRGNLGAAEKRLLTSAGGALSQDVEALRTRLHEAVVEEHARRRELELVNTWRAAEAALQAKRYESARELYSKALTFKEILSGEERAYFHRGLAVVAMSLGDPAEEERQLSIAYQLDPQAQDLVNRAYARLAQNRRQAADGDFATAVETEPSLDKDGKVLRSRQDLRALSRKGWGGWLSAGVGYDTNAAQSGSAASIGVATLDDTGSPLLSLGASVAHTFRKGVEWSVRPHYQMSAFLLTDGEVSDQSLQEHTGSVGVGYAPDLRTRLRLEAGVAGVAVGLDEVQLFTVEGVFRGSYRKQRASSTSSDSAYWDASAEFRPMFGQTGFEYMSGSRIDAQLKFVRATGAWDWNAFGAVRYYGIGTIDYPITLDQLAHCAEGSTAEACETLSLESAIYTVPLGFVAPSLGGAVHKDLGSRWTVSLRARLELRHYLASSFATSDATDQVLTNTEKRRLDFRPSLGLSVRRGLNPNGTLAVFGDATLQGSVSNLRRETPRATVGSETPEANLDYDNRSFLQHTSTVGFEALF